MHKICITADATCDIPKSMLEALGVETIPLYVGIRGQMLKDGLEITPAEIFADVKAGAPLPTTSAPSVLDYLELYRSGLRRAEHVIHISLSSGISASHQSALLAAQELENIYVIDSLSLSSGTGLVVLEAVKLASSDLPVEKVIEQLKETVRKVRASFVIDRLDFLYKGGRCSALQALGANLLRIKPSLILTEGLIKIGEKYRGSLAHALELYVDDELKGKDLNTDTIFITHSLLDDPSIVQVVKDRIAMHAQFNQIIDSDASSVISSHCGPNTLGILYLTK